MTKKFGCRGAASLDSARFPQRDYPYNIQAIEDEYTSRSGVLDGESSLGRLVSKGQFTFLRLKFIVDSSSLPVV